ncbi:MAG TPA: insulinase family protein, partial [Thermoanaerobaculia bacterium]
MTHLPKLRRAATRGLVLLFCAASALGQKQSPPAPGTPKGFRVPATKKFTLDNGLKVTLAPYGTVPKVTVELAVVAGNAAESVNEIWLADLTGDWMREGTATRTGSQISQEAARMGGSLEIGTSQNLTRVTGNALSEFGPEMVRLLADVAENPSFPESELTRLKADMARNLAINTT